MLILIDLYAWENFPTRGSVVCHIAKLFVRFMEVRSFLLTTPVSTYEKKTQRLKPCRLHPIARKWRIGDDALTARNVVFNHLVNTYENIWQVDCEIVI